MARPRDVSVSLYDDGKGEIHVWNVSFRLKGSVPNAKAQEDLRKSIQRLVQSLELQEPNGT
jgi:hypothetical protein